ERREMHTKLGLLTIAVLIDLLGFSIVIPLVPYYVLSALHEAGTPHAATDPRIGEYSGWLIAVYALMQFLFAPLWGRLSDRVGRKPILVMSLVGDAIFYSLFGVWQHWLPGLFIARILAGIFSSASLSVAQAYVADVTPPEERAVGMGMIGAAFGVGFIFGPALGGLLGTISLPLPMYVAGALALINVAYIIRVLPESRTKAEITRIAAERATQAPASPFSRLSLMTRGLSGPIGFLFLLTFLVTFAFANLEGTFTPYLAQHFGYTKLSAVKTAGGVFAYIGFLIVLMQGGAIRPLVRRFGEAKLILAGIFLMSVGFLTFALPNHLIWLMIGPMIPIAIGNGMNSPALRSLVSRKSAADVQGGTLGLSASFDSLARFLGPSCGGWLYAKYGQAAPYWFAGMVMVIALLFGITQSRKMEAPAVLATEPITQLETPETPADATQKAERQDKL
ncbi:MAG TPA: MFS transporter, partial [Capsulimonadaceae bacterium]|nr:MFS transporter [Capsulimonadaceae bacterium]